MRIVTSVAAMGRLAGRWKRDGVPVGFVPTMGYLHEGHLSLVARARRIVGSTGRVVVSLYVNPTQFGPKEDLSRYPKDLPRDRRLCRRAGVDVLFAPSDAEMYPGGWSADPGCREAFSTFVEETVLGRGMEGGARPTHFRGVTTVVAKLLNIVQPKVAVFGAKDFQQAAVVRRMVRDLNIPVRIVVAPTRREADGLAMSSRNKYLSPIERMEAGVLSDAISSARALVRRHRRPIAAARIEGTVRRMIGMCPSARLDYVACFDPETLAPVRRVGRGTHMALAVWVGGTRLIDNGRL